MVLCGGIFSVISETPGDKSPELNDEECTVAVVANNQERKDVSTTSSDGDVSPGWLKVCKKRSGDTQLARCARHR